jgi:Ser-tRNA(Ala) deacylase AlaX
MNVFPTDKQYLDHMHTYSGSATIIQTVTDKPLGHYTKALILDQTLFVPKKEGQLSDKGIIYANDTTFTVHKVFEYDGLVYHYGDVDDDMTPFGNLCEGVQVSLTVDKQKRTIQSLWHTGAHIIDCALYSLRTGMIPIDASYKPSHAYIEYNKPLFKHDREDILEPLNQRIADIITSDSVITAYTCHIDNDQSKDSIHIKRYQDHDPCRMISIGSYGAIECYGTHVTSTKNITSLKIIDIKSSKTSARIRYRVS